MGIISQIYKKKNNNNNIVGTIQAEAHIKDSKNKQAKIFNAITS